MSNGTVELTRVLEKLGRIRNGFVLLSPTNRLLSAVRNDSMRNHNDEGICAALCRDEKVRSCLVAGCLLYWASHV